MTRFEVRPLVVLMSVVALGGLFLALDRADAQTVSRPKALKPPALVKPQDVQPGPRRVYPYQPMQAFICDNTASKDNFSDPYENYVFVALSPENKPLFGAGSTLRIAAVDGTNSTAYNPLPEDPQHWKSGIQAPYGEFKWSYDSKFQVFKLRRVGGYNRDVLTLFLEVIDPENQITYFANVVVAADLYKRG